MAALMSMIVGYGFIQAVDLFSEASRAGLENRELARSLAVLDGVLVPTFGSLYVGITLLFPFVAIRALGHDKQSGALALALQLPVTTTEIVAAKAFAIGLAWLVAVVPAVGAVLIWRSVGGHIGAGELANLLLGHALYAWAVAGMSMLAAAIAETPSTAAIVALGFTLGFWVLDFAAASGVQEPLASLTPLSLTAGLRPFEHGVFSLPHALGMLTAGAALLMAAREWLPMYRSLRQKAVRLGIVALLALVGVTLAGGARVYRDVREDRHNSFNPSDEAALRQMRRGLVITVRLSPDDSRRKEFDENVLAKLRRLVPHFMVRYEARQVVIAGTQGDERYGLNTYDYAGRQTESRSTSPREILPILHELAGVKVSPVTVPDYPGHPLVANVHAWGWLFYVILPIGAALASSWTRRVHIRFTQAKEAL